MTLFHIFAIVWIPVAVAILLGFAFSLDWLEGHARASRARHPAE